MTFPYPAFPNVSAPRPRAVVVGAGVGGLASAIRLAAHDVQVTLVDRHAHAGGKIRTLPSAAGPVDAGPTVLTLRHVFDDLFAAAGARLEDHVTLIPQELLARHFWPDGSQLDLYADAERSAAAIRDFAGPRGEAEFRAFHARTRALFDAFDAPMMRAAEPKPGQLFRHVLARPGLIGQMAPLSTLSTMLRRQFSDPRLAQLFGRYATYVGGSPFRSPAVLSLIWQAEASGVWVVKGGMHKLACAMLELAAALGVDIRLGTHVDRIEIQGGRARAVLLDTGARLPADAVVFNGDPRALAEGALGTTCAKATSPAWRQPRSFSARVYSFAATPSGLDLAHHNVLFAGDPASEFADLGAERVPKTPTLYVCAEDRGQGVEPPLVERFEIITNAPASDKPDDDRELQSWHQTITQKMARFGLSFSPTPTTASVTTPRKFHQLFPGTQGALYGQSPHGMMAAFRRPTARTRIQGLYLAGGGAHPGAGVPMATLSATHAVAAILSDLTSTSKSAPTVMPGGMSTG